MRPLLTLFLILLWLVLAVDVWAQDSKKELDELKQRIQAIQVELASYKDTKYKEYQLLQQQEQRLAKLATSIRKTGAEVTLASGRIAQLTTYRQRLQRLKKELEQRVILELQAAYRSGQQDQLKILLNQESPEKVALMLRYYGYITRARGDKIQGYLQTMEEVRTVQEAFENKQKQQRILVARLQEQQRQRQKNRGQRLQIIEQLQQKITTAKDQLREFNASYQQLETLVKEVAAAILSTASLKGVAKFSGLKKKLQVPVKGRLVNRYGGKRLGHLKWQGLILAAKEGSRVRPIYPGRVLFSSYLRGYGLLVIIDHGENYMSLYGHNQTLNVDVGDWVDQDQVIALAGNTGGQSNPGLYFEIRHQGKPQNPTHWINL